MQSGEGQGSGKGSKVPTLLILQTPTVPSGDCKPVLLRLLCEQRCYSAGPLLCEQRCYTVSKAVTL